MKARQESSLQAKRMMMEDVLDLLDFLKRYTTTPANRFSGLCDTLEKLRVILKAILEPVLFRLESDEHAGWLAVPRYHDLFTLCHSKVAGQIVLQLS